MRPLDLPGSPDGWLRLLSERCDDQLDDVRRTRELIASGPADPDTTLERWNDIATGLLNATTAAGLLSQAHPEQAVRERAELAEQAASTLSSEIRLDRRVYDALAAVDPDGLDPTARRMLEMTLRDFRRAGVDLDEQTRDRLQELTDRETALSQAYERTVNDDVRTVTLRPHQLDGLPADYLEGHPAEPDGAVVLTTDYPDVFPVRTFARDPEARRAVLAEFDRRGWPANEQVLHELLRIRAERARLLGYPDWPDYDAEVKMIGSGTAIAAFIDRLDAAVQPAARAEVEQLRARQLDDQPDAAEFAWSDLGFYVEAVRRERFGVDAEQVRGYFDFAAVHRGLLEVTGRLFGLEYVAVEEPAWHAEVTTYDVLDARDGGRLVGRIHLDLHPRAGKFKHAAHFPLVKGLAGRQLPQSALLCNLPRGLMGHDDVVTLFHEFGHLIHALLGGGQQWARFSGVATERDFIEAPSQMLEEWAWDHRVLSGFARGSDGEPIPADLVERMRAAQAFGRASMLSVQVAYTAMSYGLHADVPDDLSAYVEGLLERYLPFAQLPDTYKHASFGHLADPGYSSAYYTYLWSLVLAKDLFSGFDHSDLFDAEIARRYRDRVLAPGGSVAAADLVEGFLGRPTSTDAFDRWLAGS
ncbi:M3 family metallopeptidase [Nocardioides mesophilus]|uniref:Zn-dependent oligopeptidase n=1 Tax=Nocardioides mesophilus TaxID=433659 RepID=A0A7G9RCE0_9ACTN|nr:M3 family metallopeptidase [Nocardioides mesophilus]QNN53265.1 Zn-dependent oligopeptidase [Nocardioides mesophilus]